MIRHEKIVGRVTGDVLHRWHCEMCMTTSIALRSEMHSANTARLHIQWHAEQLRADLAAMPPAPRTELVPVEPRRIRDASDIAGETRDRFAAVFGEDFLHEVAK